MIFLRQNLNNKKWREDESESVSYLEYDSTKTKNL